MIQAPAPVPVAERPAAAGPTVLPQRPGLAAGVPCCDVAIIGAGPYGLAAAAHLSAAGLAIRPFGRPMAFWAEQMPRGMLLRSSWDASHIADPRRAWALERFQAARRTQLSRPIPLEDFVEYGRWFQRQAVPNLDTRRVERVETAADGFWLTLEDGEPLRARRVIVATGIAPFAHRPAEFERLPAGSVSHTVDHQNLRRFAGQRVVIVGAGQNAIESAALLSEAGAEVEVIARAPRIRWLTRSGRLHRLPGPLRTLLYPPTDVGPPGLNWLVALPDLFRRLPRHLQDRIAYRSIRPAASGWLVPRVGGVRVTTGRRVAVAAGDSGEVALTLDDGTRRVVDHVLLATGFRIDVAGYPFLAPGLLASIRAADGYPLLRTGFESSVPDLHFVGATAARSFGPLMRFVSGTAYAGRALTRALADGSA